MRYKNFNIALRWVFASLALVWVTGCIFAYTSVSSGGYYRVFGFWVANSKWEGTADWVADKGDLIFFRLLLLGLVYVIVNSFGKVILGQPKENE
jgi:hypothetical protein